MSRTVRMVVLVGAVLGWASPARAGFISVLLTAGPVGGTAPSSSNSFQFTNPSGAPLVAVSQVPSSGMVKATTGGGFSVFSGAGLPVVLNIADGSAYLASTGAPSGSVPAAGLASAAPSAGGMVPPAADLLTVALSNPAANGAQVLTVGVTDAAGDPLGTARVTLPSNGWWVLGLTPGSAGGSTGGGSTGGGGTGSGSPGGGSTGGGGLTPSAATPEPATVVMTGLGLPLLGLARVLRRKVR
jgi:hypothetical protein